MKRGDPGNGVSGKKEKLLGVERKSPSGSVTLSSGKINPCDRASVLKRIFRIDKSIARRKEKRRLTPKMENM